MDIADQDISPDQIVLIEDDGEIVRVVRAGLDSAKYQLHHAPDIATGRGILQDGRFDAIILDLTLPDGDGLQLAESLRNQGSDVPILMLTARSGVDERVSGFRHGADDYLCKPFAVEELVARLEALLRRTRSRQGHKLKYADVELDLIGRSVRRGDVQATLSAREMDLLVYFIRHAEQVLERGRILEDVWGDGTEDESNVLNVYVNYLRNKLEQGRYPRLIHTVRGVGFILSEREVTA